MELPIEIIGEIISYFAFSSYMWCLSKKTHKYWTERALNLAWTNSCCIEKCSKQNIEFVKIPIFLDNKKEELFNRLIPHIKSVSTIFPCRLLHRLVDTSSPRSIYFRGRLVHGGIFMKYRGINIFDYLYRPERDDLDVISEYFPQCLDLFVQIYPSPGYGNKYWIEISDNRSALYVRGDIFLSIDYDLSGVRNLVISDIYKEIPIETTEGVVQKIINLPNLHSCMIETRIPESYLNYLNAIKKYGMEDRINLKFRYEW